MIIKNIEISGFGKLEKFDMNLEKGLQVIYGPNEFGKSTLMRFLKMMFYSRIGNGRGVTAKDKQFRQRCTPWSGAGMRGSIEFLHNGDLYKVQKDISPESPSKDIVVFRNLSTGEIVELGKKEEVGERLFGIDIKSFERSSYIGSLGRDDFQNDKSSKDSLADKIISNLSDTGEEDVSKSDVMKKISDAIKALKPSKGSGGIIRETRAKINDINKKIYCCKETEEANKKFSEELLKIQALRKEKNHLCEIIESVSNSKKLEQIDETVCLIENKQKLVDELGIPCGKIYDYVNGLNEGYQVVKSGASKLKELENVLNSVDKKEPVISEKEMNGFNCELKSKKEAETNLKRMNGVLKEVILNPKKYFLSNDFAVKEILKPSEYNNLINSFKECEKTDKSIEDLRNFKAETDKKATEAAEGVGIQKEKTKKEIRNLEKKNNTGVLLQSLNIAVFILLLVLSFVMRVYIPLYIYFPIFITGGIWGIVSSKRRNDDISELNEQLKDAYENYSESYDAKIKNIDFDILAKSENLSNLRKNLKNILENSIKELEQKIYRKEKAINDMMISKECKSMQGFYELYAKNQSINKIKKSYDAFLKEFKANELKFIKKVSLYNKVSNLEDALSIMNRVLNLSEKIQSLDEQISVKLAVLGFRNADLDFLKGCRKELERCDNNAEYTKEEIKQIEERCSYLKNLDLEEKYIETQKSIKTPDENIENLEKKLSIQKDELASAENYHEGLQIALKTMEEAADELRRDFNPKLDLRASEIFGLLTDGAYHKIHIGKDYGIVVNKNSGFYDCENFSSGTIDQAYLALRIAISEFISSDNYVPLILDDAFIQYDDKRLERVIKFFDEYANSQKERQVILFTCHKSISELARKNGATVIC